MAQQIALQLYTVRRELQDNPEETLEKVKGLGIDAVEVAPLSEALSARRLASALRSLAFKVVAIHCDLPLGDRVKHISETAQEFNCDRIIWHGWPRDPAFDTLDGINRLIDQYNEAYCNAAQNGLQFGLHNHWWEFEPVEGRFPYQLLLERLSPEIFIEIDTYWVRAGGLDPAAILRELYERVTMLHLKDGSAKKGDPMTALGAGVLDFRSILKAVSPSVDSLVIELDECEGDIWEAVKRSFHFLCELRS